MGGAGPAPIRTKPPRSGLLARKKAALPRQDSVPNSRGIETLFGAAREFGFRMLVAGMAAGDFYIICPDNDVTRDVDNRRILWAAEDIIRNRPALSRWYSDYRDEFAAFLALKAPRLPVCFCANRPNSTNLVLVGSGVRPNFPNRRRRAS
jgi:hypothetical protein